MFNKIKIENFRGIKDLIIEPLNKINIFVGDNMVGKTAILDSLFIAINLPDDIKSYIESVIHGLKEKLKDNKIKWVNTELIHITLFFLGDINSELEVKVRKACKEIVESVDSMKIKLDCLSAFPNINNPRVVFIKGIENKNILLNLYKKLQNKLLGLGIDLDTRPFKCHLTIGRNKGRDRIILPQIDIESLVFDVKSVELMSSELFPDGPIYSIEDSFKLI